MNSLRQPISRRSFLTSIGLGALGLAGGSRLRGDDAPVAPTGTVVLPSAYFGTATPEEAGFSADVATKMATFLQGEVAAGTIPGAFVAAMRHGKVFLEQHYGVYCSRTQRDAPYDGAAIHPFHSISKMVSATAVMMAAQDGLIKIDDKVSKYIPGFETGNKGDITIRSCLDHSAGIPKPPPGNIYADTEEHWQASIAAISKMPLQWPTGSRTEYHGLTGMLTSAECVRRQSGHKPWDQILQERIFTPLGMSTTTFMEPPANLPWACVPRPPDPALWDKQLTAFLGQPAAGLKTSFTDLLKFLSFQTNKGTWQGKTLLQEKFWTEMHTDQFADKPVVPGQPGFESWGLGMMVRDHAPISYGLKWFGLSDVTRPQIFSHVGTDVAMAIGDPATDTQIVFIVTDKPKTKEKAMELRDTVTATVFKAMSPAA
jgi:CubicO group peptidase (beta-lactamase class C family)